MTESEKEVLNKIKNYNRTCLKRPLKKKTKIGFKDRILLSAGQKYCKMLQGEHSAIRPVYIESRVCVVKGVVKCSFEYLCVVRQDTRGQHNLGVGEGTI